MTMPRHRNRRGRFPPALTRQAGTSCSAQGNIKLAPPRAGSCWRMNLFTSSSSQDRKQATRGRRVADLRFANTVQRARRRRNSWGTFGDMALEGALAVTMIPSPLRAVAAASVRGFTAELGHQFSGNKDAIAGHLKELRHVDNLKSLFGGYYGGLAAGIVSPLTGLFGMFVFADRMRVMVNHMVADAANRFAGLSTPVGNLSRPSAGLPQRSKGSFPRSLPTRST